MTFSICRLDPTAGRQCLRKRVGLLPPTSKEWLERRTSMRRKRRPFLNSPCSISIFSRISRADGAFPLPAPTPFRSASDCSSCPRRRHSESLPLLRVTSPAVISPSRRRPFSAGLRSLRSQCGNR